MWTHAFGCRSRCHFILPTGFGLIEVQIVCGGLSRCFIVLNCVGAKHMTHVLDSQWNHNGTHSSYNSLQPYGGTCASVRTFNTSQAHKHTHTVQIHQKWGQFGFRYKDLNQCNFSSSLIHCVRWNHNYYYYYIFFFSLYSTNAVLVLCIDHFHCFSRLLQHVSRGLNLFFAFSFTHSFLHAIVSSLIIARSTCSSHCHRMLSIIQLHNRYANRTIDAN